MSLERLSPKMRNCILELQAESVVDMNYKSENKNNTESLLSRIFKSFR